HAQVIRVHYLFPGHVEAKTLGSATDDDLVTLIEFKEVSEEGVAVCGDYGIAGLAGRRCLLEVSGALTQLCPSSPLQDDGIQLDRGKRQAGENRDWGGHRPAQPGCRRGLALPFSLEIVLRAVHIEVLRTDIAQQTGSNDQERQ